MLYQSFQENIQKYIFNKMPCTITWYTNLKTTFTELLKSFVLFVCFCALYSNFKK